MTDTSFTFNLHNRPTWPRMTVSYELVKPDLKVPLIPTNVMPGRYQLKTPEYIDVGINGVHTFSTGIRIQMPEFVDVTSLVALNEQNAPDIYPRFRVYGHIRSCFEVVTEKGLMVLGPEIISSNDTDTLKICVKNISDTTAKVRPGDVIAELSFSVVPDMLLGMKPKEV